MTVAAMIIAASFLLAMFASTSANHGQSATVGATTVNMTFDHDGDNEWWVEVLVKDAGGDHAITVEARAQSGTYHHLQAKAIVNGWNKWGTNTQDQFRIPPGERVQFRALVNDASTGNGAFIESCFFTHPAGVEQCGTPPVPGWNRFPMGSTGTHGADDMAVGDGNNDGRNEVYVGTGNGIQVYSWTPAGWARTETISPGVFFARVAIGDANNDGRNEVYGTSGHTMHLFFFDGESWGDTTLAITGTVPIGGITVGDVDDDGLREVYFGTLAADGPVFQVRRSNNQFSWTQIAVLPGGTRSLWIGDADSDGDRELVIGSGDRGVDEVWSIDAGPLGWTKTLVDGSRSGGMAGVVAGDADRDGRSEVYAARVDLRSVHLSRATPTGWTTGLVATLPSGPTDLALGDADNDGSQELYATAMNGHLYQVRWSGTAWIVRDLATASANMGSALAIGDGDNDGKREVYLASFPGTSCCTDAGIFMVSQHAAPPRPAAPPAFWAMRSIGDAGEGVAEDLAIGDVEGDARNEIYVALRAGLTQVRWNGATWVFTLLDARPVDRVVVMDLDRDGRAEVYASIEEFAANTGVFQYKPSASGWQAVQVFTTGNENPGIGSMSAGDVDDDGHSELYVMMGEDVFDHDAPTNVHMVWTDGAWRSRILTSVPGGARSSWVADGNRDGDRELYLAGNQKIWQLDGTGAAWSAQFIDEPTLTVAGGGSLGAIVAGDGDRDGLNEVYVSHSSMVLRYKFTDTGWARTIPYRAPYGFHFDMTLGDADNDGSQELYLTNSLAQVFQLRWAAPAWSAIKIQHLDAETSATDLLIGDADGDGTRDLIVAGTNFGRSPRYDLYDLGPPLSGGFDATFTGVRGNEWWTQATVKATGGTLAKVDVRLNGGAWQPMTKQSWGGYASPYRVVQGTQVQMRATATGGATDLSACYRWIPASNTDAPIVTCGSTPGPDPTTFDATFTMVKGNEWWVEAKVTANRGLGGVDARVNCQGAWTPMTLRSWGSWAASFHIPSGAKVDLRARAVDGAQDLSGGYVWPAATPTSACAPPPPPGRFVGAASSGSITNNFQLDAASAGSGRVGAVQIVDNVGSITFLGRAWPVVGYVRTPWPTYGDLILYHFVSVQPDGFMAFYLYCRSGQMTHVWFEAANRSSVSSETTTGPCVETLGSFSTPATWPAADFPLVERVAHWRVAGTDLNYDGTTWGRIKIDGVAWQWWPFMEVNCSSCEANGFFELHSLMREPVSGKVAFGIVYFHEETPTQASLHYGLKWAPAARINAHFYAATGTRN